MTGKSVVLYLSHQTLISFTEFDLELPQFTFPLETFLHGEVIDSEGFRQQVGKYFDAIGLADREVLLTLAPDLVFAAKLSSQNPSLAEKITSFVAAIPIEKDQLAFLRNLDEGTISIFATNQKTFATLAEVIDSRQNQVTAVVPAAIFPALGAGRKITSNSVKEILANKKQLETSNFLKKAQSAEELLQMKVGKSRFPLMIVSLMVLGLGLLFAIGAFFFLKK